MTADLEAVYSYNQEGMLTSETYPLGANHSYASEEMGRPTKMTDTGAGQDLVSTGTYGPSGEDAVLCTGTGTLDRVHSPDPRSKKGKPRNRGSQEQLFAAQWVTAISNRTGPRNG